MKEHFEDEIVLSKEQTKEFQKLLEPTPIIGVIMGSKNDFHLMKPAIDILTTLGIPYETEIVSAHRTPDKMAEYSKSAVEKGLKVIIAGAGGSAHLPGMVASYTPIPVIGVPLRNQNSINDGLDSLLSIVQMPYGVPVATVGVNQSANAAILAAQIIGTSNTNMLNEIIKFKNGLSL